MSRAVGCWIRRWTLTRPVLEGEPWHRQHQAGSSSGSRNGLQFRQFGNDIMDPVEQGRDFCDWCSFHRVMMIIMWVSLLPQEYFVSQHVDTGASMCFFFFFKMVTSYIWTFRFITPLMQGINVLHCPEDGHTGCQSSCQKSLGFHFTFQ